jgi:hypothetical protein
VRLRRCFTSSSRRAWAFLSAFRGCPVPYLGVRESPCRTVLAYGLTEAHVEQASCVGVRHNLSVAATIFVRRSSE